MRISVKDIQNNAWITVNNAIWQWFSRVTISREKIIAESPHEWQKSLFTVTNVLIYFLRVILCPEHKSPLKQLSIADFAIVAKDGLFWPRIVTSPQLICDVTRTWDTGIATSYWRKDDLYSKTIANIDFSSPAIHGLACKIAITPLHRLE